MISMTDYKQIIQLRNKGQSQEDIALILGISRRTVIRYLKDGKIPSYSRKNKSNKIDPLKGFYEIVKEKLELNHSLGVDDLFEYIVLKGYKGSIRTLRRKTRDLRISLKNNVVFFQRLVRPGEVIEGDFTEFHISIAGTKRKIYLWVASLPYSNKYFVTPYYHCSFESFADGSEKAFIEFNGIADKYRLDNMSPAVSKILKGKDRIVTERFHQFQNHYGFKQDFCNPGKGNEKGNVEANNKYIKKKIMARISLYNLSFTSLDSFTEFVWSICREHNSDASIQNKFLEENLKPLPVNTFPCYRTAVVSINKYSLFSLEKTGHMYSVPSKYIGLSLEVQIYPDKINIIHESNIISNHKRLYGPRGIVSISVEHIIDGLIKKPGAMKDWKYREVLFERPAWINFYKRLINSGKKDKDYLNCLRLINKHGRDLVTVAMELLIDDGEDFCAQSISKIISNETNNIYDIEPLNLDLNQYDYFLKGDTNESQFKSQP